MELKTIKDVDVKGKRVFLRVDFNVSMNGDEIADDFRIKAALKTIDYLIDNDAKLVIATHLGRPEGRDAHFSTKKLAMRLKEYIGRDIKFVPECIGSYVRSAVDNLQPKEVIMLENLRFYSEEEKNDEQFASELASLADIYVNDAFSVCHRTHASVSAITKHLPSYSGFLLDNEISVLSSIYNHPDKPLVIAIGGAKAQTKVEVIKRFFDKADHILVGGVMANVILEASGRSIGKSAINGDISKELEGVDLSLPKLHIPVDVVIAKEVSENAKTKVVGIGAVDEDSIILDIGPETVALFSEIVKDAKTVVWNGPLGYSEIKTFARGTDTFAKSLCKSNAYKIIGGGDSITALDKIGMLDNIDFVSTGGGAMLEFLAGNKMPGIEPLMASKQ